MFRRLLYVIIKPKVINVKRIIKRIPKRQEYNGKKLRNSKASTECNFEVRENYHYSVCKTRDGKIVKPVTVHT